jgi:hypothetical protein
VKETLLMSRRGVTRVQPGERGGALRACDFVH